MGGQPLTALQYLAWPRKELAFDIASQVIAAGMDVMAEAGCTVVGGHSIDSPEPTYGFAVTGTSLGLDVITNAKASPGDALVLTKPLGMGIITTAIKRGECPTSLAEQAIEIMATLNQVAGSALIAHGASAATDVTGFGLLGHLSEMCDASGVGAVVEAEAVPVLEGVHELLEKGMWAGGSQRNANSILPRLETDLPESVVRPLIDAQTSGGLLVAIPESGLPGYLGAVPGSVQIGRVTSEQSLVVA